MCVCQSVFVSAMKHVFLLLLAVAGGLAAKQKFDLDHIFSNLQERMWQKSGDWLSSRRVTPVTAHDRRAMLTFEAAALAGFSPQARNLALSANAPKGFASASRHTQDLLGIRAAAGSLEDACDNVYFNDVELKKKIDNLAKLSTDIAELLQSTNGKITDLPVRKDYRCMSQDERDRFHAAVNKLKSTVCDDGQNIYDKFTAAHNYEDAPGAHLGPAFLPWHRHLLLVYQHLLALADPRVVLPYWDSSHEIAIPDALKSIIWTENYMGNAQLQVVTGPFADWPTGGDIYPTLWRNMTGVLSNVYNDTRFEIIQSIPDYTNTSIAQEGFHNFPHDYVSGDMGSIPTAARDPIFFMHHAFVDCVWEEWREVAQYPRNDGSEETEYPTDAEVDVIVHKNMEERNKTEPKYHYYTAVAVPFTTLVKDGLQRKFTQLYYTCQPHGTCPNDACGSDGYGGDHCLTPTGSGEVAPQAARGAMGARGEEAPRSGTQVPEQQARTTGRPLLPQGVSGQEGTSGQHHRSENKNENTNSSDNEESNNNNSKNSNSNNNNSNNNITNNNSGLRNFYNYYYNYYYNKRGPAASKK